MTSAQFARAAATEAAPALLRDGRRVWLRPVCAGDAGQIQSFVRALSPQARRNRFFSSLIELPPYLLRRLAEPAPGELVLLAREAGDGGESPVVGIAQYVPEGAGRAEFSVAVHDAWQRRGLGTRLIEAVAARGILSGIRTLCGVTFAENAAMRSLAVRLGFKVSCHPEPGHMWLEKPIVPHPVVAAAARFKLREEFR